MAYHDDYEVTPSIRTYNHSGLAQPGGELEFITGSKAEQADLVPTSLLDTKGKLTATALSGFLLHSIAPRYVPVPPKTDFHSERIFGNSYANTFKGSNIRLGTVTRYPVMCGCEQNDSWGLGWQSMPVSAAAMRHETSFLRFAAVVDGKIHAHPAGGRCDQRLFPDENIIDNYTFSAQTGNCAVVARMATHIANRASYFADEWYFQHFDGQVKNIGNWFVFDYGDCALAVKSLTGSLKLLQKGENLRLVNALYEGEDKSLVCRRFFSCWAIAALDNPEDLEGQLSNIPAAAEKNRDLRYSRQNPCLRLTCGKAVLNFDPDKTALI